MGHLINPIGFRLGWSSGWCDSWYSDAVFYPEFLHDIFRVRLFLNYFFSLVFFEKASLTFSHFEFFHKYAFLALRVFYYDGALMAGIFTFQTDFYNSFFRKGFVRFKRRNRKFLGSRNGRFFLSIFYGFFKFSNFFKAKFVRSQSSLGKGPLNFRTFQRRDSRLVRSLRLERKLKAKKMTKKVMAERIKAMAKARAQGRVHVPYRKPRKHVFFFYKRLLRSRSRRLRVFKVRRWGRHRFNFRRTAGGPNKGFPFRRNHGNFRGQRPFGPVVKGVLNGKAVAQRAPSFTQNFKQRAKFSNFYGRGKPFRNLPHVSRPKPRRIDPAVRKLWRQRFLERKRRQRVFKIFKGILRHCSVGRMSRYLKRLRLHLKKKPILEAELKIFVIFLILFRRVWFLFRASSVKAVKLDLFKEIFFTASFLFFYNALSFRIFSGILRHFLNLLGLSYLPLRVGLFLISNDTVTALFLSSFIGRKLVQGYRYREVLNPIMHDLYKASRAIKTPRVLLSSHFTREPFSAPYKNGVIKAVALKFFFVYKRMSGKFFWLHGCWLSHSFYKILANFYGKFSPSASTVLLGFSKKFLLHKQSFLFFFNYDNAFFNNSLSFVFNDLFFDFVNRDLGQSLFFYFIFDELFSQSSVLFFGQPWKRLTKSSFYPIALFFFNRLVRYSYWRYSRNWLLEFNALNKLRLRLREVPEGLGLLGFKVHLRGRFSRKQKASSLWYTRGQLPLNTVSATIDYAFRAYPLRNSLVSVKVWLYKSLLFPKWFVRQF